MGDQNYDAWYIDYPKTHACAGQTVEVVTRAFHDKTVDALIRERDAINEKYQSLLRKVVQIPDALDKLSGR